MSVRHRYQVYGLTVESDLPLSSVPAASDADSAASLSIAQGSAAYFDAIGPVPVIDRDDWVQHAVLADGRVYMRAEDVFEATVCAQGRTIVCRQLGSLDERTLEANLLNFVISASLTLRGEEPLHATVVELNGSAIGLLGRSGAGKSTLAAFLISRGADLLTDDMLRVTFADDAPLAHPGPYRLKLIGEASTRWLPGAVARGHFNSLRGKIMVEPRERTSVRLEPLPLAALFVLCEPDPSTLPEEISSRRLGGLDLARTIISSAMDTRYAEPQRLARQLRFADRLATCLPIYELRYPRNVEALAAVEGEIRSRARA